MSWLLRAINSNFNNDFGQFTATEIERQPRSWKETAQKIFHEKDNIAAFCEAALSHEHLNIVLTGAGSSAFIGNTAADAWQKCFKKPATAIATTDLVTHFKDKILTQNPLLLISFARSGNSPESVAAVELANEYCSKIYHLIITCNADGQLAAIKGTNTYVFLLPEGVEDKSLAMTNSFTSMLVAALTIPKILTGRQEQIKLMIDTMADYANVIFVDFLKTLQEVSAIDFNRVVFLGSGPNAGIAQESHLKVQELTNGKVIGKYDSFLGFRHGPKAVITKDTLLVYLLSNRKEVQPYELDLIEQVNRHNIGLTTMAISETAIAKLRTDYAIILNEQVRLDEDFWAVVCTLLAQIIGFFKSIQLQLNPDNPSPDGTIARVVEGVTIYPTQATSK